MKAKKPRTMKSKPASRNTKSKKTAISTKTRTFTRALMFAMMFAIVGIWYLIATQASNPYRVRFVFFCAQGASCQGSQGELNSHAQEIRNWFQGQVGRTFEIADVRAYTSGRSAGSFDDGGSDRSTNTYYNIHSELSGAGLIDGNTKTVVMLGFRSMSNCGIGAFGGELAIGDRFKGNECQHISAVLAHELGHNLALPGTNSDGMHDSDSQLMHAPLACAGRSLGQCGLNQSDKNTAVNSPWFAPPEPPKATIQGIKVIGTGSNVTTHTATNGVEVIYLDGAGWGNNTRHQRDNPYFYHGAPQGLHRIGLYNIPADWEVVGYTLCYDTYTCHGQNPQPMQANPLSWYTGIPSVVIDTRGRSYADLYFHFKPSGVPKGNIDSATCDAIQGWTFDPDDSNRSIDVHVYMDGAYGSGTTSRSWNAGPTSVDRSDVNNVFKISGKHGFNIPVPTVYKDGRPHTVHIYGINIGPAGGHWYATRTFTACGGTTTGTSTPVAAASKAIRGVGSNLCVDVPKQNFSNGVALQLWDCNGSIAQKWTFKSDRTIRTSNNKCVDVNGGGTANGSSVILWDCHGGTNQQWKIGSDGTLRSVKSNRCLDANAGGKTKGTKLIIWDCHGGSNQRWNAQ